MKRTPIVLVATVAGFAGVLSFHTSGTSVTLSTGGQSSGSGSASSAVGGAGATSHPSSTTVTSGSHHSSTSSSASSSRPGAPARTTTTKPPATSTAPATTTAPAARQGASRAAPSGVRSATGAGENFGYGVLSVKVTVNGSKITSLNVANLQVAEPTSQYICQQAIPMLRSEVLQAQSIRINAISGATYTSEAYAYSIQSALDKLHVR